MMRVHVRWFVMSLGLVAAGCASPVTPGPGVAAETGAEAAPAPEDAGWEDLAWLVGLWSGEDSQGVRTEESWTAPDGGAMAGVNRTIVGGRTVFFENLRIEIDPDGVFVYLASPRGRQPPTPFRLEAWRPGRFVFENPVHDYPQRIIYERTADGALVMRIEGREGDQVRSSQWELVPEVVAEP